MVLTHWVCSSFFKSIDVQDPRRLVCRGSFPACCRHANVIIILKCPTSSSVDYYQPISITSVCLRCLSFGCRFVSHEIFNTVVGFQPPSLLIGKVWAPVIHFSVSHILHIALKSGPEARIMQIDFIAAFDKDKTSGNSL